MHFRLLVPLLLCACAGPDAAQREREAEWRTIQRARLARLYSPPLAVTPPPPRALEASAPQDPVPPRGERHIDDLEPRPATSEPRPYGRRGPPPPNDAEGRFGALEVGVATLDVDAGPRMDDSTKALAVRLLLESPPEDPSGVGFHLEGLVSEDDLFTGRTIPNGLGPARADAEAWMVDAFPHFRVLATESEGFAMPLRLGVFFDWFQLSHDDAGIDRSWSSFGPRAQLEPSLRLFASGDDALHLFGRVRADVGGTRFHEEFSTGDDSDVVSRWSAQADLGLRFRRSSFLGEFGYRYRHVDYGDVDSTLLVDDLDLGLSEVFLALGFRF